MTKLLIALALSGHTITITICGKNVGYGELRDQLRIRGENND